MRDYQRALEAEVAKRTEQLQRAFEKIKIVSLDTIYRLARAAEYKDEDTGAHLQRMSHYAAAVARRMDLNEKTMEAVLYASPMHDVGKIGIPDRILLKPGRLDNEEWEIMKQHTTIGSRILEGSTGGFIKLAEVIALTHHEKWDGSGYPQGLKGAKIPLLGRITAIADVFDALNSKRPYKDAFPVEESFRMIREGGAPTSIRTWWTPSSTFRTKSSTSRNASGMTAPACWCSWRPETSEGGPKILTANRSAPSSCGDPDDSNRVGAQCGSCFPGVPPASSPARSSPGFPPWF
jgi:hypothetical protein